MSAHQTDVVDFLSVFAAAPADAQAIFAGHLAFVVARGADLSALRPEFTAPLARFAALVDLDDALSPTDTAAALDAFFVDHAVDARLVHAFEAFAGARVLSAGATRAEQGAAAAQALLATTTSKVPVGAVKVAGAVPGGTLGLLQMRTASPKKAP